MRRVFPAYGVRFIAINDNVDTENDAADDLTVSVKNIMNEAYSRDISVKTRSALDVKRRSGDFVGAFPIYGYIKAGDKHKSLEIDEYAANVVPTRTHSEEGLSSRSFSLKWGVVCFPCTSVPV